MLLRQGFTRFGHHLPCFAGAKLNDALRRPAYVNTVTRKTHKRLYMLYILKRLTISMMLLIVMGFFTFWLIRATPGSFFDELKLNPQIAPETITRYENLYHVHDPILMQYGYWLINALKGDFGYSFYYNVPVSYVIGSRLFNTFLLSIVTIVVTWLIAIPLGVMAALHANRWLDRLLALSAQFAFGTPSFFLAIILLYIASQWGVLPLGGMHSNEAEHLSMIGKIGDVALHLIIPVIVLSVASIGSLQRIMRGNLLGELNKPYILAARARGLSERAVIFKHALRNAFNPLITLLGFEFAGLLSGAALVEIIVAWPGLGTLMLTAVRSKDIYVVMTSFMMAGGMLLIGNLLADLLLTLLDPRVRDAKRR